MDRLRSFLLHQLATNPFDEVRKRVRRLGGDSWEIAYRTWRIRWRAEPEVQRIIIDAIRSGYTEAERVSEDDPYQDKAIHRAFVATFDT